MNTYGATWAEINLDNLKFNYCNLVSLLDDATKVCCVVKANAYGHGSLELAKFYVEQGADYLAVATPSEALELRKNGVECPLMCLGYVPQDCYGELLCHHVDVPVYSLEMAEKLSDIATQLQIVANIHIKLDSGMSRIGFQCTDENVEKVEKIYRMKNLFFKGVFTHFARADEQQRETTDEQFERYCSFIEKLERRDIYFEIGHCCNTAGAIYYPQYHLDMVRLGIGLYGYYPSDDVDKSKVKLKPAMSVYSCISHLKKLEKGRGISYGHRYCVNGETELIATIPIGYADGFTRMLYSKVEVEIGGECYPVVGSICMDQCMVRLNCNKAFHVGDKVTIYSDKEGFGADRLARNLGTISYEILCMLQRRVPRVYVKGSEVTGVVRYL